MAERQWIMEWSKHRGFEPLHFELVLYYKQSLKYPNHKISGGQKEGYCALYMHYRVVTLKYFENSKGESIHVTSYSIKVEYKVEKQWPLGVEKFRKNGVRDRSNTWGTGPPLGRTRAPYLTKTSPSHQWVHELLSTDYKGDSYYLFGLQPSFSLNDRP